MDMNQQNTQNTQQQPKQNTNIIYNKNIRVSENIYRPFVYDYNQGYNWHLNFTVDGVPNNMDINIPGKPTLLPQVSMWNTINRFEQKSWSPCNKGFKTGWKNLDRAFDGGIKPGFQVIGADSNLGKTGFISQLAWQVAVNNDDVYVLDFSLDDAMDDKLPRVIACNARIPIGAAQYPDNYKQYPLMLIRRINAINALRNNTFNYNVYDVAKICSESETGESNIEDIFYIIQKTMVDFKTAGINKRIFVTLDNFHDLSSSKYKNPDTKFDEFAKMIGEFCDTYRIPFICSAELKKLNSTRRPISDDVRNNVKIKYKSMCIMLGYNEVHYKGEQASVFYNRAGFVDKQPIFELHFAKNKLSSFKGRLFFYFLPEMSRMEECSPSDENIFKAAIYGS